MKLWRRIDRYTLPRYSTGTTSRVDEDVTGKNKYRKPLTKLWLFQNRNKILMIIVTGCILLLFFMRDGSQHQQQPSSSASKTTTTDSENKESSLQNRIDLMVGDGLQKSRTSTSDQESEPSSDKNKNKNNNNGSNKGGDQKIQSNDKSDVVDEAMKDTKDSNGSLQQQSQKGVADVPRRDAVKEEFLHAWSAYKKHAWGKDDLHPISKKGTDGYHMGLTLIDSLSTILVMGLDEEAKLCKDWIESNLKFGLKQQRDISVFESTIRVMGGLLSAYAMTNESIYKTKAKELADYLIVAFDTATGLPKSAADLGSKRAFVPGWQGGGISVAEAGTLQLEWRYLSKVTGNPIYREKVDAATEQLSKTPNKPNGLFTRMIDTSTGRLRDNGITLGARVDSVYEYFLKAWVQSGKTDQMNLDLYISHIEKIIEHLVAKSPSGLVYFQELINGKAVGKMDHLVCFMGGMLALGSHNIPDRAGDLQLAEDYGETCYNMYKQMATGLSPEIVRFEPDLKADMGAKHNLLRPETVESLFYLWRFTHNPKYREWGWEIFEAFKKWCRVPEGGYSNLNDVVRSNVQPEQLWQDKMESFFLAETLKYLYLLFDDDNNINLDAWVFNTEAHPLPILTD